MKKCYISTLIIFFLLTSLFIINNKIISKPAEHVNTLLLKNKILGRDLFNIDTADDIKINDDYITQDEEPIFWDLSDGANISYNPVTLFVNYYYWDYLPFYDSEEEYVFEMYANKSVIFDSSYEYSRYNEYFWYLGYDWNISSYDPGTNLNLTVFFYQESDVNINHTASISVTINELKETPTVDVDDFIIDLFHWSGSLFTAGYYYLPSGYNAYYHFKIYEDGYVTLKYADNELYDSKELSSSDAKELLQELIDLGFYQLKDAYFSPGYDYFYQ